MQIIQYGESKTGDVMFDQSKDWLKSSIPLIPPIPLSNKIGDVVFRCYPADKGKGKKHWKNTLREKFPNRHSNYSHKKYFNLFEDS